MVSSCQNGFLKGLCPRHVRSYDSMEYRILRWLQ